MSNQQKSIFYSRWLWIMCCIISCAGIWFTYTYFHKAIPIFDLTISMDRDDALKAAQQFASQFNVGPEKYRQAAVFNTDQEIRNFVELEGGGSKQLVAITEQGLYSMYTWKVRHFAENNPHECTITFKPDGTLYGFYEYIPEDAPGEALSENEARNIAQTSARESWSIDLSPYALIEHTQITRPNERIDHTFTYERTDQTIGNATYRLTINISGNKVTQVAHHVNIPESFNRRYENMRSSNNTIMQISSFLSTFLYMILGCIFGLLFLVPNGWIVYRPAIYWALFICGLLFVDNLNSWPLYWMYYNTAYSSLGYALQLLVFFLTSFGTTFVGLALIFIATESLTRAAFGDQIQLWKIWSKNAANSIEVAGQTIAGYFTAIIMTAYVIFFYWITLTYFNWWQPINSMYDPNILAKYMPWFSPLIQSLNFGFSEECLYRAVPLACAMLLGKRFGKQNLWVGITFVLQAIIFGAAHADYPVQPAYARVVEFIIPSLVYGGIYLRFGLLPAIISHVMYDVACFSIPVFASHAPIQQLLIIAISSLPLLIVLISRWKYGSWTYIKSEFLNKSFKPDTRISTQAQQEPVTHKPIPLFKLFDYHNPRYRLMYGFIVLIMLTIGYGAYKYYSHSDFKQNSAIKITINRAQAIEQIYEHFKDKDLYNWTPLTIVQESIAKEDRFIWQTNKDRYKNLLDSYLMPPHFKVRLVQFEGDINEREEEYILYTNGTRILDTWHIYAEDEKIESLSEQSARELALTHIENEFEISNNQLKEISVTPSKKPHRMDWTFIFQDITQNLKENGQARIIITISGNKVSDSYRTIFVPETWERNDEFNQLIYEITQSFNGLTLLFIIGLALFLLFNAHAIRTFNTRMALLFFIFLIAKVCLEIWNAWYSFTGEFNTTKPYMAQLFSTFTTTIVPMILSSGRLACAAGIIHAIRPRNICPRPINRALCIFFTAFTLILCAYTISMIVIPHYESPLWSTFSYLNARIPALSMAATIWTKYVAGTLVFLFFAAVFDIMTKTSLSVSIFTLIVSLTFIGFQPIASISNWIIHSLILTTFATYGYNTVFKYDRSLIPIVTGMIYSAYTFQQGLYNGWNGVWMGVLLTIMLIMSFSLWWSRVLQSDMKKMVQ